MSGTSKRAPPPLKAAKPAIYPRPGPKSAGLPPTMQKGPSVDALMGVFQPQPQQRSHLVPHRETAPITDRATEEAAQTVKKQLSAPAELRQSSQGQSTTSLASSLAFFEDPPAHMSDDVLEEFKLALANTLRTLDIQEKLERRRRKEQDAKWAAGENGLASPMMDATGRQRIMKERAMADAARDAARAELVEEVKRNFELKLALAGHQPNQRAAAILQNIRRMSTLEKSSVSPPDEEMASATQSVDSLQRSGTEEETVRPQTAGPATSSAIVSEKSASSLDRVQPSTRRGRPTVTTSETREHRSISSSSSSSCNSSSPPSPSLLNDGFAEETAAKRTPSQKKRRAAKFVHATFKAVDQTIVYEFEIHPQWRMKDITPKILKYLYPTPTATHYDVFERFSGQLTLVNQERRVAGSIRRAKAAGTLVEFFLQAAKEEERPRRRSQSMIEPDTSAEPWHHFSFDSPRLTPLTQKAEAPTESLEDPISFWVLKLNVAPKTGAEEWKRRFVRQEGIMLKFYKDATCQMVLHDIDLSKCKHVRAADVRPGLTGVLSSQVTRQLEEDGLTWSPHWMGCGVMIETRTRVLHFVVMKQPKRDLIVEKLESARFFFAGKRIESRGDPLKLNLDDAFRQQTQEMMFSAPLTAPNVSLHKPPRGQTPKRPKEGVKPMLSEPSAAHASQQRRQSDSGALTRRASSRKRKRFDNKRLDDLSSTEYNALREAAVNEIMSLMEEYNLMPISKVQGLLRPTKHSLMKRMFKWSNKKETKEDGVFGVPLEYLSERLEEEAAAHVFVAPILLKCIGLLEERGLDTPGIFRVPGSAKRIEVLKKAFESDPYNVPKLDYAQFNVHDVAGVLKMYLRELPEPLLLARLYRPFLAAAHCPAHLQKQVLRLLVIVLPTPHRACLEKLLTFLAKVAARAEGSPAVTEEDGTGGNKMTSMNLALVLGPNILREEIKSDPATNGPPTSKAAMQQAASQARKELADSGTVADVVRALIDQHADLWTVPTTLVKNMLEFLDTDDFAGVHGHDAYMQATFGEDGEEDRYSGVTDVKNATIKSKKMAKTQSSK